MKTIWKFEADETGGYTVDVAYGRIIHVAAQRPGDLFPCLWVEHVTDGTPHPRYFQAFGTGNPLVSDAGEHVGSAVCANGELVWHIYSVPA